MSKHRFCIDVECLFDFRLGTIATYSSKAYQDCFLSDIERYISRDHDRFHEWTNTFDEASYLKHYTSRDINVFQNSIITNVFKMLQEIKQELVSSNELKEEDTLEININLQHYTLKEEDQYALTLLFQKHFGYEYPVKLINVPIDKLTPTFIKSNFDVVFMYDFEQWSRFFIDPDKEESLFNHPMGQVIFYIPYKLIPPKEVVTKAIDEVSQSFDIDPQYKDNCQDPKLLLSSILLGYVHLIFCDLSYYSVTTSILKK